MKKIIFFVICICSFSVANAEPAKYYGIVNKCSVISNDVLVVPVSVISVNDGILSKLISNYKLGMAYNEDDVVNLEIKNVTGGFSVKLDSKRDSVNNSNIYFSYDEDIYVNKNQELFSFELIYKFKEDIPNSIYVLGNDVIINDSEDVCAYINGYKIDSYEKEIIVKEKNIINYVVIVVMLFVIFLLGGLLWKEKKVLKD